MKIVVNTEDTEVPSTRLIPMVFDNLLRNSAKYAEKDVTVTFEITSKDDYVYITMSDDGPGVSKEIQSNLFEKGVSTTGGGYGLYLSKRVVEGYGGSIELIQQDQGTAYRILLPTS